MIIFQIAKTAVGTTSVRNHLLLHLGGLIQLLGTLAAAFSAFFAFKTIKVFNRSTIATEKSALARIFLDVSDLWSKIYDARNELLSSDQIVTADYLHKEYGNNFRKFLKSTDWQRFRHVCNFYEKLGVIIDRECIDPVPLFVLVTVDVYKEISFGKIIDVPEGIMYKRLKGPIEYLREVYRPDIYKYYDHYLLPMYKLHIDGVNDEDLRRRVDAYAKNHRSSCRSSCPAD